MSNTHRRETVEMEIPLGSEKPPTEEKHQPGQCPARGPLDTDEDSASALQNTLFFMALFFRYPEERIYAEIDRHLPFMEAFFIEYGHTPPKMVSMPELQSEYVQLFVNNQGFVPAVPYASCHIDRGQLMGDSFFRLRQMMADTGFFLDGSVRELEDHLSILLEYAASLVQRLAEKKRFGNSHAVQETEALMTVTAEYIRPVIESIADAIETYTQLDYYRCGIRAMRSFTLEAAHIYEQVLGISQHT